MSDREIYGRHLREVVDQVRALPLREQRSRAIRTGPRDSPRWCALCETWGDHHTDRHIPVSLVSTERQED